MNNMIELLIVVFVVSLLIGVTSIIIQSLWLRKSNIKNWGLVFVPIFSSYKIFHYFYDMLNGKKLNNLNAEYYVRDRRKWSWIFTGILIVLVIITSSFGIQLDNVEAQTSNGMSVSYSFNIVHLIISTVMIYSMFRSVSKISNSTQSLIDGQFSPVKSMIYTLLSIFTFGIFFIIAFVIFLIKDDYQYVLSDRVNEHELND